MESVSQKTSILYADKTLEHISKEQILNVLRDQKVILKDRFGVEQIGLFGSYLQGPTHSESDIDLAVKLSSVDFNNFTNLQRYLENLFQSKIDLFRFRDRQTNFQKRILEKIIYA